MNTKKLFFLTAIVVACFGMIVSAPQATKASPFSNSPVKFPQEDEVRKKAKERVSKMYKNLEMSRDQYNSAWDVAYNYEEELHEIKQSVSEEGNREDVYKRFKKVLKSYKSEMKEVLDSEQYKRFAEGKWQNNDREAIESAIE